MTAKAVPQCVDYGDPENPYNLDATEFAKVISMNDKKMPSMQMERTGDSSKKSCSSNSVDRMEREGCPGRLTQRIVRAPLATYRAGECN